MSIQLIAKDLYRLQRKIDEIEKQLEKAPAEKQEKLKDNLRKIKAERDQIRYALDGAKEKPKYRVPR